MKTPKRYPATMSVYISSKACFDDRARWKRKNRVKQPCMRILYPQKGIKKYRFHP